MATFTNATKNISSFIRRIRHGVDPVLLDLSGFTFTDDIFGDGRQLQNLTFAELSAQAWANFTKHTSSFSNTTKH